MSNLIRVRTDDVLVTSEPMKGREFQKWKKHHDWVLQGPPYFYHTAAIVCTDLDTFPEARDFIREEVAEGRLAVDLHGWEHVDYGKLDAASIRDHVDKSFEYFLRHFGCLPYRWCTPWGASSEEINTVCREYSLIHEGVSDPVVDQGHAMKIVREADSIEPMIGKVIMVHWFERGLKLFRIIETAKHGSWEAAAAAQPELFK